MRPFFAVRAARGDEADSSTAFSVDDDDVLSFEVAADGNSFFAADDAPRDFDRAALLPDPPRSPEVDAVLFDVALVLVFIPFKPHYSQCSTDVYTLGATCLL